jgi:hypothetical protein
MVQSTGARNGGYFIQADGSPSPPSADKSAAWERNAAYPVALRVFDCFAPKKMIG